MAYRWVVLLCALTPGSRPPFRSIMRVFFVSTFVGSFLPSVGGDLYRAYSLSRLRVSAAESAASVFMDRMLGVQSMVIVGLLAGLLDPRLLVNRWVVLSLAATTIACGVAAMTVFSPAAAGFAQAMTLRLPSARAQRIGGALVDAVRRYRHHHGELTTVLAVSILVQMIRVVQAYCLGRAIGMPAPLAAYFVFVPIAMLIMQLPVTIQGLGTGQWVFTWLFGTVGTPAAAAVALSLLFVALGLVGNLPGALLYAFDSMPERPERPAQ